MTQPDSSRSLSRSFWIPIATLGAVEIYASRFDGWGAWATAPLFLLPFVLSLVIATAGAVETVRAPRGATRTRALALTAIAALPLFWLLVRRHFV